MVFPKPTSYFSSWANVSWKKIHRSLSLGLNKKQQDIELRRFKNGLVTVCTPEHCDCLGPVRKVCPEHYLVYTSNEDGLRMSRHEGVFNKTAKLKDKVYIDYDKLYQRIIGFGGAFTDATGINLEAIGEKATEHILRSYFSDDGISYSLCRVPIGGTDFSTRAYSYNDTIGNVPDFSLCHFELEYEDAEYKIPYIQKAFCMSNRQLNLFASAWTAPKWMKTNNSYVGGSIKKEMYQTWAEYHARFLERYRTNGIKFWGLTTGNEPSRYSFPFKYGKINSIAWSPKELGDWVCNNLGPTLAESGFINTKIIALDDQRSNLPDYIVELFKNETAKYYVDGIACHWYFDCLVSPKVLTITHDKYPEKFMLVSESCNGSFALQKGVRLGSWTRAERYALNIIENLEHWGCGWVDYNMVLDLKGGPNYIKNYVDAPIIVDPEKHEFYKQPMYYAIGHFSKFIPRGSVRVHIEKKYSLDMIAMIRPDNATVIVVLNRTGDHVPLEIQECDRGHVQMCVLPKSINTIVYWG